MDNLKISASNETVVILLVELKCTQAALIRLLCKISAKSKYEENELLVFYNEVLADEQDKVHEYLFKNFGIVDIKEDKKA